MAEEFNKGSNANSDSNNQNQPYANNNPQQPQQRFPNQPSAPNPIPPRPTPPPPPRPQGYPNPPQQRPQGYPNLNTPNNNIGQSGTVPNGTNPNNNAPNNGNGPINKGNYNNIKNEVSEADKIRIAKCNEANAEIAKRIKRVKKPNLFKDARPLVKVRRIYTAKISHRAYYEKHNEIARIRSLISEGKGGKLVAAGVKKTKRIILSLVLIFAILAVIGTGSFVTVMLLQQGSRGNPFDENGLTILNLDEINITDDNYIMGTEKTQGFKINNSTGHAMYISFKVSIRAGNEAEFSLSGLNLNDLMFEPLFNEHATKAAWFVNDSDENKYEVYYLYQLANNTSITIIDGYKISLSPTSTNSDQDWVGQTIKVDFIIDGFSTTEQAGQVIAQWPREWLEKYNELNSAQLG